MVSIIIATRNRPKQIQSCLYSILNNSFQQFEILLVDQSTNEQTKNIVKKIQSTKIRYFRSDTKGKSKGLNFLIQKAKHSIIACTDDDCVVDKNWLKEISKFYVRYPQAGGVFGNVLPYMPQRHRHEYCTSLVHNSRISKQTDPYKEHWLSLGIGNNMSFQKSVIEKEGAFKEWLGPGSLALNGEETDLIFRLLTKKYTLMTNPNMLVYHNRWLSYTQLKHLLGTYSCGMSAFYAYYLYRTHDKKISALLQKRFHTYITKPLLYGLDNLFHKRIRKLMAERIEFFSGIWELYCFVRGWIIGTYYGIKDQFHHNRNKQSRPTISLLISLFSDRTKQFEMSLRSLTSYPYDTKRVELLVFIDFVDNTSIVKLLQKYRTFFSTITIFVVTNKRSKVAHSASRRNFLATQAKGTYIIFSEPEMFHLQNTLQHFLTHADKKLRNVWIGGPVYATRDITNEKGELIDNDTPLKNLTHILDLVNGPQPETKQAFKKQYRIIDNKFYITPYYCAMFNKNEFLQQKGLNQHLQVRGYEEMEYYERFSKRGGRVILDPNITTIHLPHPRSIDKESQVSWNLYNSTVTFDPAQTVGEIIDATYKKIVLP